MSSSRIARTLRPAVLLAAGMLAANVFGGAVTAAPVTPAATHTRVASCWGLNFHPIHDQTTYRWDGWMLYRHNKQGDGWFLCDPNLPHKAVVTRVRFTVRDTLKEIAVRNCALQRSSLGTSNTASQTLGLVSATGLQETPGTVRKTDSSIERATTDHSAYS